jgi:hypothetical protein
MPNFTLLRARNLLKNGYKGFPSRINIQVSQNWRTNYLLPYRGCLNVHEKYGKNVSDKKIIYFYYYY